MRTRWVLALALLLPASAWAEPPRRLGVDQAVDEAIGSSPQVQAARARQAAAEDAAKGLRGRLLPSVHLSDEQQHYDSPFAVTFALPRPPGAPAAPAPSFVARNQNTNTFAVAAGQPVLGLLHLGQDRAALDLSADAAGEALRTAEADVREAVQTQFLRLFEARATEAIATTSEKQLEDQIAVARSKLAAGVLTQADVLRLQVAAANARQQAIQAQAEEEVARAGLLAALGLAPDDASVDFEEPARLEAAQPPPALPEAVGEAIAHRPELAGAQLELDAAAHRRRARLFELLPEVSLEAAYLHIHGQVFAPEDSGYVGLKADWAIWEWGASWYAARAAGEQEAAAQAGAEGQRRRIGLEVSARLSQERASASAVEVAQTAIASAEEAYRVTQALEQAGSATTTDLLDAQGALTQAKLNLVRARYEQAIAMVALRRALGD